MFTRNLLLLAACLLFFTGCPAGPATQGGGTTDPEVGQRIKGQIDSFVEEAKKSSARGKANLSLLLESLEGNAERGGDFAKVRDEAKKLQELYQANAGKGEISAQIEALQAAANELAAS